MAGSFGEGGATSAAAAPFSPPPPWGGGAGVGGAPRRLRLSDRTFILDHGAMRNASPRRGFRRQIRERLRDGPRPSHPGVRFVRGELPGSLGVPLQRRD